METNNTQKKENRRLRVIKSLNKETRASQWRAIAYPSASAIAYLREHQNSKCVPPVLIHRAITCDSFKVLAKKKA